MAERTIDQRLDARAMELLAEILSYIDQGKLVRNTVGDHATDWAVKLIPLVSTLAEAQRIVAASREGKEWLSEL
jgi:hypothetical protein